MLRAFRIARIAGIDVHLDVSLGIIFILITLSLATGVFPAWHPGWSAWSNWGLALCAAVLFFASVLAHEFSHALVGRAGGIPVSRITLFVFGGVAQMEGEPRSWRAELAMAAVGPVTSLVLGGLFLVAGSFTGDMQWNPQDPQKILASLSPATTLLLWLGQVNVILALFNLVPGFPLDGGRVLRAILWGVTGDRTRATQRCSVLGQLFAWFLIATGILMILGVQVPVLGGGAGSGLWLALIGWFLNNAARISYHHLLLQEHLDGLPAVRLARTRFDSVSADLPLQSLVDDHIMSSGQRGFPVLTDGRFDGMVCLEDVRGVPRDDWRSRTVRDVMTPARKLTSVGPRESATEAFEKLARRDVSQVPVVEDGRLRGLLRRDDILKWLTLREPHFKTQELG